MVEVKSVTLANGTAGLFPDAVSARAARHCDDLALLVRSGHPAAIVFVAQRADVESVAPEDVVDPAFGAAIRAAAQAGVQVVACALDLAPDGAARARRVPSCCRPRLQPRRPPCRSLDVAGTIDVGLPRWYAASDQRWPACTCAGSSPPQRGLQLAGDGIRVGQRGPIDREARKPVGEIGERRPPHDSTSPR